jgi:predicted kinase
MLKVGNDDLNSKIEPIIENCLYLVANQRYYIINAYNLEKEENKKILNLALQDKNKSFCIDGYTASINMALQQYQDKSRFKIIY